MLKLHHEKSKAHLREHWPEIQTGVEHLKQVLAIEFGERAAKRAPTAIFDNYARKVVQGELDTLVDDFLESLESQK